MKVHLHGMGLAGVATLEALASRGIDLSISDDAYSGVASDGSSDTEISQHLGELAERHSARLIYSQEVVQHLAEVDQLVPAPGVAENHPVITTAQALGCEVVSEIELAYRFESERAGGPRPMVAITGTDGKTTTCLLAAAMLNASGMRAGAVGNTETPLIAALDSDLEVFVVECSSFRLAWTHNFRAESAVWLNLAPDHLNWHRSLDSYAAAKARIFQLQASSDVAIGNVADPVVVDNLLKGPARPVRFGSGLLAERGEVEYWSDGSHLYTPDGQLLKVSKMWRGLPHDQTNALAAAAAVLEIGLASTEAVRAALAEFVGAPHRIELVGESDGVAWFNDSKATTPHAAAAAIAGFDSVVLIAGGRNKDLDLSGLRSPKRVRAVVAIGEAAQEIEQIFIRDCPVQRAGSMADAVLAAAALAKRGDVVLLSPGCASFDWYPLGGYGARGDDFRSLALAVINTSQVPTRPADAH
jgi:UDP-N-acetylmuramoylalanine--D-glutamate ligase